MLTFPFEARIALRIVLVRHFRDRLCLCCGGRDQRLVMTSVLANMPKGAAGRVEGKMRRCARYKCRVMKMQKINVLIMRKTAEDKGVETEERDRPRQGQ